MIAIRSAKAGCACDLRRKGVVKKIVTGLVDCDFTFFNVSWCVMLLFEYKQYLQTYNAES